MKKNHQTLWKAQAYSHYYIKDIKFVPVSTTEVFSRHFKTRTIGMSSIGSLSLHLENIKNVLAKCIHFRGSGLRALVTAEKSMIDFQSSNKSLGPHLWASFIYYFSQRDIEDSFVPNKYPSFKYQDKCHLLQEAFPKYLSPRHFSSLKERRIWIA